MSRYLIVAHQTVSSSTLVEQVARLGRDDPAAEFSLVVPATPVKLLLRRHQGDAARVAAERIDEGRAAFAAVGVDLVDALVGDASPLQAVTDELARGPKYDRILISTLPAEDSQWLRMDLPAEVRAQQQIPVLHVQATLADLERMQEIP